MKILEDRIIVGHSKLHAFMNFKEEVVWNEKYEINMKNNTFKISKKLLGIIQGNSYTQVGTINRTELHQDWWNPCYSDIFVYLAEGKHFVLEGIKRADAKRIYPYLDQLIKEQRNITVLGR